MEEVFRQVARNLTLRLAEKLAQYICSLTRRAESLATPETECLLYATYWFRPILSELIGAATESADVNRERAPSGPVKVVVTHRVPTNEFREAVGCLELLIQRQVQPRGILVSELDCLQYLVSSIPLQSFELTMRTDNGNFLRQLCGATFLTDEARCNFARPTCRKPRKEGRDSADEFYAIVASGMGSVAEKWKQTATLCPLDWPSNYSLLRLWHTTKSFHQYAAQLKQQMQHRHMFSHWEINRIRLASRVLFQRPAHYAPEATLMQHVREREFPDRRLRKKTPETDRVAFQAKCNELRLHAAEQERLNPVSFAIGNSWTDTLRADKQHYLEYTARGMT